MSRWVCRSCARRRTTAPRSTLPARARQTRKVWSPPSASPRRSPMPEVDDPLPPLRDVIAAHGLAAKKSLGQNFLLDLNLTRRIARAAGPLEDSTIYEVGPGPGGLTRALLLEGAREVVAVEREARCIAAWHDVEAAFPGRLRIVEGDALSLDEPSILPATNVRIAANLPYNIGSALLVKWLTSEQWPPFWQSATLMFQ